MELVGFQVEGFTSRLHHFCKGGGLVLDYIGFDGEEWKIFRGCVDELQVQGKSDILKKVGESTVYVMEES